VTLPRGFKSKAEADAARLRRELALRVTAKLDLSQLAAHLGCTLVSAENLVGMERLAELERVQAYAFSAATFRIRGRNWIVTNPLHSPGRRNSDVAHELAHLILDHELSEVREIEGVSFRTCQPEEEEQATVFGATLLLPRPLLLQAASRGLAPEDIAVENEVTVDLARYRYNTTGIRKQVRLRSG
jgi:Zn-dependent peptidase ImmA (M78 family)